MKPRDRGGKNRGFNDDRLVFRVYNRSTRCFLPPLYYPSWPYVHALCHLWAIRPSLKILSISTNRSLFVLPSPYFCHSFSEPESHFPVGPLDLVVVFHSESC